MEFNLDLDWEEAYMYRQGQKVELKSEPGAFDIIACYEPMMVPPIWLVNDPKPRYAHELKIISQPVRETSCLLVKNKSQVTSRKSQVQSVGAGTCH